MAIIINIVGILMTIMTRLNMIIITVIIIIIEAGGVEQDHGGGGWWIHPDSAAPEDEH